MRSDAARGSLRAVTPVANGRVALAMAMAMAIASALLVACTTPATGVVVHMNTDAPDRVTVLRAVIGRGASLGSNPNSRAWTPGPTTNDLHFPASFGIVPARGDGRDGTVTVQLEAQFSPIRPGDPVTTIRRLLRFSFIPNVTSFVHVYLNTSCANFVAPPSTCSGAPTQACTMQRYCEERSPPQTCGDDARCATIDVRPTPTQPDGGPDDVAAVVDGVDAGGDSSVPVDIVEADVIGTDASPWDVAMDTVGPRDATTVDAPDVCVRSCAGRMCGSDGCGGSCGICAPALVCNAAGACVSSCTPSCSGRMCGTDGCSGTCGTCPTGRTCNGSGQCACAPNCSGRNCGTDGCGGSCGTCAAGQACNASGQCQCTPNCAGRVCGADGCGGTCGVCATGSACTATGQCVCVPNCPIGRCGPDGCGGTCACATFETCRTNTCCPTGSRTCSAGQRCCGVVVPGCGCDDACTCSTCDCP